MKVMTLREYARYKTNLILADELGYTPQYISELINKKHPVAKPAKKLINMIAENEQVVIDWEDGEAVLK